MVDDTYRATGRSKRQCLRILLAASRRPNEWVNVEDHWGTRPANRLLLELVVRVARVMDIPLDIDPIDSKIKYRNDK